MDKQYLSGFAAIFIVILIIVPSIAGAEPKSSSSSQCTYENVTACQAKNIFEEEDVFLLDVRTPAEFNYSHIEGATLIPLKNVPAHDPVNLSDDKLLPNRMKELPKDKNTKIVVYCYTGKRAGIASQMIADAGYKRVYNIQGGLTAWVNAGYPIVIDPVRWLANYPHNP
ncbi:MAG TPA: rhodanese-like domain-containing protein [Methanosarcina sp.]